MGRTAVCGASEFCKSNKLRRIRRVRQAAGQKRREIHILTRTSEDLEETGVVGRIPRPKTARPRGLAF